MGTDVKTDNEPKFNLVEFVEELFSHGKEAVESGIFIKMATGSIFKIEVVGDAKTATLYINDKVMGEFEAIDNKCYKCVFMQKYRKTMRDGLLEDESFVESICESNNLILLNKAYQ